MKLPRSSTLTPMLFYAASGGAFALANLLLARQLPEHDYAVFTLVLTMMTLAPSLAAAGLDSVAVRGALRFVPSVGRRVCAAAGVAALALVIATATYGVGVGELGLIFVAGTAGGSTAVAAAEFQRRHRFALSLILLHTPNYTLLVAAAIATLVGRGSSWPPLVAMSGGSVGAAVGAWWLVLRPSPDASGGTAVPWAEAFTLASTNASGTIMTQLDRLIIPYLLPLGSLATYGALSSVAGSLFRVVQRGVGYTLLPRLRASPGLAERRRLLTSEARLVGAVALLGSLAIWIALPAVEHWVLDGRYHFPVPLVLATLLTGCAKLVQAFSRAAVTALADTRELVLMNLFGWVSLALSVVGAVAGARWGLVGVVYGVGAGWAFRTLAALAIMYRHLRPVDQSAAY